MKDKKFLEPETLEDIRYFQDKLLKSYSESTERNFKIILKAYKH
jgi:hypothetical protein